MGSMVCLCGKRYRDPVNMYTKEEDPFWICLDKCQRGERDTPDNIRKHNEDWTPKVGGMVWGK